MSRIARLAGIGTLCLLGLTALPVIARAQILGDASPGTPGAIEGEGMGLRRMQALPARRSQPEIPLDPTRPAGKYTPKRNPNATVKRAPSTQRANTLSPGLAPRRPTSGQSRALGQPADFSGTRLNDPFVSVPRANSVELAAPGLPEAAAGRTRRPANEADPYAPLGIRAGTMILRPAIEASIGYDTNPARSATQVKGSPVYKIAPELRATSDWSRHQLDLELKGAFTGYSSFETINRPEGDARIALRLDVTRDLQITSEFRSRIDTESTTSVDVPAGTTGRVPYYTQGAQLGATQRYGRLSLGLRGTLDRITYGDAQIGGTTVSMATRDYTGAGLRLRMAYEITPGISPFMEAGGDIRRYDLEADASGFRRSSDGLTARAGTSFEIARTLTGEAALGYTYRTYADGRLSRLASPTADAALLWSISPLTTLNLRAQTEAVETTLANSPGAIAYRGTATLSHAFLRNLTGTALLGASQTNYRNIAYAESTLTAGLRIEYKFNRTFAIRSSYAYDYSKPSTSTGVSGHTFLTGIRITP